jgi:hypothetical protein
VTLQTRYASTPWGDERGDTLDEILARPSWQQLAVCRGMRLATFFPEAGDDVEPAREVCRRCPVRVECRGYALEAVEPLLVGIWGRDDGAGTAEAETGGGVGRLLRQNVVSPRVTDRGLNEVIYDRRGFGITDCVREAGRQGVRNVLIPIGDLEVDLSEVAVEFAGATALEKCLDGGSG